jgi:hypothetical protein
MRARLVLRVLLLAALIAAPLTLAAQRGLFGRGPSAFTVDYNGRFTFTRIRYNGGGFFGGWSNAWNHDYPEADRHIAMILEALTSVQPNLEASNILDLEDPEIFRNPILYMWEPGFWLATDDGAANLGQYMLKGGFVIFDDFEAGQWVNFEEQFRRALPGAEFIELEPTHPIFHTFFDMDTINVPHPSVSVTPVYFGVFRDNDPTRRMMALVNFNNDVAEYWEYSATGRFPVDTTNDAYKLGINYMIYGLTR